MFYLYSVLVLPQGVYLSGQECFFFNKSGFYTRSPFTWAWMTWQVKGSITPSILCGLLPWTWQDPLGGWSSLTLDTSYQMGLHPNACPQSGQAIYLTFFDNLHHQVSSGHDQDKSHQALKSKGSGMTRATCSLLYPDTVNLDPHNYIRNWVSFNTPIFFTLKTCITNWKWDPVQAEKWDKFEYDEIGHHVSV